MGKKPTFYSSLHDAELVSVVHEKAEKKLSLGFTLPNGHKCLVIFEGVIAIRILEFITQNVVSRVLHTSSMVLSDDEVKRLVSWANELSGGELLISEDALCKYVERTKTGDLKIFSIEPSWGAEVVCLYEGEVSERTVFVRKGK